ncbi:MAG: hypothetical protein HY074_04650 [Deltaproteobacteria bacterium]|nr:hypothetical protein [Deltaproteobacteria bacterium]
MMRNQPAALLIVGLLSVTTAASAVIRPSQRHEAGGNKTGRYISEGFFAGGEHTVTTAKLKDIRRAKSNEGFERIVFDLDPQVDDKESVPYFQVQAAPEEGRFVMSIWANVQYDFDSAHVSKNFAKSAHFKRLNVIPRLEEGLTIIEFTLAPEAGKKTPKFEVFRLAHPARIIMDVI